MKSLADHLLENSSAVPAPDPMSSNEQQGTLDEFSQGYIDCALWASSDDEGDNLDQFSADDIDPASLADMLADCKDFQESNWDDLQEYAEVTGHPLSYAGHDFWLTRNGHGAGFWDRGAGEVGDRLSDAAKVYGSSNLYYSEDDGMIYAQ